MDSLSASGVATEHWTTDLSSVWRSTCFGALNFFKDRDNFVANFDNFMTEGRFRPVREVDIGVAEQER